MVHGRREFGIRQPQPARLGRQGADPARLGPSIRGARRGERVLPEGEDFFTGRDVGRAIPRGHGGEAVQGRVQVGRALQD